jgi:hypothetical protein
MPADSRPSTEARDLIANCTQTFYDILLSQSIAAAQSSSARELNPDHVKTALSVRTIDLLFHRQAVD